MNCSEGKHAAPSTPAPCNRFPLFCHSVPFEGAIPIDRTRCGMRPAAEFVPSDLEFRTLQWSSLKPTTDCVLRGVQLFYFPAPTPPPPIPNGVYWTSF